MSQKIIKLPDVMQMCALSRSSIYQFIKENRFPKPIPLGVRAVGWSAEEVAAWVQQRAELRGTK